MVTIKSHVETFLIMTKQTTLDEAVAIFRRRGGILRTSEVIRQGIQPRTLYAMREKGGVERPSRGVYRFAGLPPLENPDLVPVAIKVPQGVVCLISALAFHEITTWDNTG